MKKSYAAMRTMLCAVVFISAVHSASALTIIRDFIGGTPPTNSLGAGTLTNIFNEACDVWELAYPNVNLTLTLHYGWAPVGGGQHTLNAQGGTPNRETDGIILFNNDNDPTHYAFFLDDDPLEHSGTNFIDESTNLGAGPINATRCFKIYSDDVHFDLFTIAMHEIGHSLGMSSANTSFAVETTDGDIDVTAPLPFVGTVIPMQYNNYGVTPHIGYVSDHTLMSGSFWTGDRVFPSALDILANAQISKFESPNINLAPIIKTKTYIVQVAPDKGNPKKTIPVNMIDLSWIQPLNKYELEQCSKLVGGTWTTVTNAVSVSSGWHTVSLPIDMGQSQVYFRLKQLP